MVRSHKLQIVMNSGRCWERWGETLTFDDFVQFGCQARGVFPGESAGLIIICAGWFYKQALCACLEHGHGIIYKRLPSVKDGRHARVVFPCLQKI